MASNSDKPNIDENKRIVAIGGGHGLAQVLYGLRDTPYNITAIVTAFDSGGSTGTLRKDYGVPSAGDYTRACLALSGLSHEALEVLEYRFDRGPYNGHTTRNGMFVAAWVLRVALKQGDPEIAMKVMKDLLKIKEDHNVYLSSIEPANLCATVIENDETKEIIGEAEIDKIKPHVKLVRVYLDPPVRGYGPAIDAIKKADMIVVGPGSLSTSIIPNLLVDDITEAINSSGAIRMYIPNIMTEKGHTDGYTVSDHIRIIQEYGMQPNVVLINTIQIADEIKEAYATKEDKFPVEFDESVTKLVDTVIEGDFLSDDFSAKHDPQKIAGALIDILFKLQPTAV